VDRSFHVHISVHNLNKPTNATKNTHLRTYSLAKEDGDNLIRNSQYRDLMARQNTIINI